MRFRSKVCPRAAQRRLAPGAPRRWCGSRRSTAAIRRTKCRIATAGWSSDAPFKGEPKECCAWSTARAACVVPRAGARARERLRPRPPWTRSTLARPVGRQRPVVLEDRSQSTIATAIRALIATENVHADGTRVVRQVGDWSTAWAKAIRPRARGRSSIARTSTTRARRSACGSCARACTRAWSASLRTTTKVRDDRHAPRVDRRAAEPGSARPRGEARRRLTNFADPQPQIRGIRSELVKYQRADGVALSATLYLPANYEPGTRCWTTRRCRSSATPRR
jgi:hypothetical protein